MGMKKGARSRERFGEYLAGEIVIFKEGETEGKANRRRARGLLSHIKSLKESTSGLR